MERESQSASFEVTETAGCFSSLTPLLDYISEWDEVPSDDEDKVIKEDECKYVSLKTLEVKVYRSGRAYN